MNQYLHDKEFPEWKQAIVNGTKTCYKINQFGEIYNAITGYFLKTHRDKDNYQMCSMTLPDGRHITIGVHRVVGFTFIPNDDPEHKTQINHKNANKDCNWVGNLEWCTPKENVYHAYKLGLENSLFNKGEANTKNVFSEEKIREVCKLLEDPKMPPIAIQKITGVHQYIIDSIKSGKIWTHISKGYNIADTNFRFGENHTNSKYKENQIREICKRLEKGIAPGKIAKELGVHDKLVQSVRRGKAWAHISKDYKFPEINYKFGEQKVQAKYTEAQIRKACELLTNPKLNFEDIARETGVNRDTVVRITKGTHWAEIAKDYDFTVRDQAKKKMEFERDKIIELFNEGNSYKEIYDIMKSKYGMADHPRAMYHLYDIIKNYKKSSKS